MKKAKIILFMFCSVLFSCADKTSVIDFLNEDASTRAVEEVSSSYYFKITPEMRAWKSCKSYKDMLRITQISESLIGRLSTEDLVNEDEISSSDISID